MTWTRRTMMLAAGAAAILPCPAGAQPPSFNGKRRPWTIVEPPTPAPAAIFTNEKNGILNFRRYRGRVLLVNFWATWCPACLHELPDLDRLQARLVPEGMNVMPINLDTDSRLARPYYERLGIRHLPLYLDPHGNTATAFGLREGLPWNFLIDRESMIQGYLMGAANWTDPDGIRLLRHYLG